MRRKRETAKELDRWILFFRCYAEFLRYHCYSSPPLIVHRFIISRGSSLLTGCRDTLLTGVYNLYAPVEMKIKTFLEKAYQDVIKEYSEKFEEGKSKDMSIIINALREKAFDEKWVIEGMKNLFLKNKEFRIRSEKDYSRFYGLIKEMREFEKRAKKTESYYEPTTDKFHKSNVLDYYVDPAAPDDGEKAQRYKYNMKNKYYRNFLRIKEIFRIQYLYCLLHKSYYEYKIPPYTSLKTFEKDISKVEKILS